MFSKDDFRLERSMFVKKLRELNYSSLPDQKVLEKDGR